MKNIISILSIILISQMAAASAYLLSGQAMVPGDEKTEPEAVIDRGAASVILPFNSKTMRREIRNSLMTMPISASRVCLVTSTIRKGTKYPRSYRPAVPRTVEYTLFCDGTEIGLLSYSLSDSKSRNLMAQALETEFKYFGLRNIVDTSAETVEVIATRDFQANRATSCELAASIVGANAKEQSTLQLDVSCDNGVEEIIEITDENFYSKLSGFLAKLVLVDRLGLDSFALMK